MDPVILAVIVALILAIVFGGGVLWHNWYDYPSGPCGLPVLGYRPFLGDHYAKTFKELTSRYGSVFSINLGGFRPVVIANDYESMKEITVKQAEVFSARPRLFLVDLAFQRKDIVFADGRQWKEQRRFSLQLLKSFGFGKTFLEAVIVDEVDRLTEYLNQHDGDVVDITDLFFVPVVNIIWGMSTGKTFHWTDDYVGTLRHDLNTIVEAGFFCSLNFVPALRHVVPTMTGYTEFVAATRHMIDYLQKEVDDHVGKFHEKDLRDFTDHYLQQIHKHKVDGEEQSPFDGSHLICTIMDLFVAGTDPVESTLCWTLLYAALHQDVQEKVQKELDEKLARNSYLPLASKGLVPYTEATLMEIQRHVTPVSVTVPHRNTTVTTLRGHKIPKDSTVFINIYAINHDDRYWDDPEAFDPGRFLDENGNVKRHEHFQPFSAGPRLCLGDSLARTELFIFFSCLLRRFSFHLVPDEPLPSLVPIMGSINKPKPFSLVVKCRPN